MVGIFTKLVDCKRLESIHRLRAWWDQGFLNEVAILEVNQRLFDHGQFTLSIHAQVFPNVIECP